MEDPRKAYKPEIGSNFGGDVSAPSEEGTYADIDALREDLELLINENNALKRELEDDLVDYALTVDPNDQRLAEAHKIEWPSSLSEPGDRVPYRYYKALRLRNTTSASYIRKRFEEAARDVTGTSSIDLMPLADVTTNEALLVQEFLNAYVDEVNDSSEQRVLETFQDWVQSGIRYTRQLREFFDTRKTAEELLPEDEIKRATTEEAKQGQAVFKVQLNGYNDTLVKDMEFLTKNFSEYASLFYGRFLGPALKFRLNVGRRSLPTGSQLQREIEKASTSLEDNLRMALADQMRRRLLYEEKVERIFETIKERDKVRGYIVQLATKGRPIPTSGPRVLVPAAEKPEEVEFWISLPEEPDENPGASLKSSHSVLDDLDDPEAHPQYLLKSGDTITGDIILEDGVQIGGIVPGTHRHTGQDGSERIQGSDIVGGTVRSELVDLADKPDKPTALTLLGFNATMGSSGSESIDAELSWRGNPDNTFEVQISRIGAASGGS